MSASPSVSQQSNVRAWAWVQARQFVVLLSDIVALGALRAIWQRQFNWRAFFAGIVVLGCGLVGVGYGLSQHNFDDPNVRDLLLWGVSLLSFCVAGIVVGRMARRLGYWEIYCATLLVIASCYVQLAIGWESLWHFGQAPVDQLFAPVPMGERLLGPLWDRLLALGAAIGFLVALFGASLAFLFYADTGKRDLSFSFEWTVARQHLLGQRRGLGSVSAWVAVVGIGLGVASLIAVTAVMSGYQDEIQEKILSTNAHLVVQKYGVDFSEYPTIIEQGLKVPGIIAATPFAFNEALLGTGNQAAGVLLKGVVPQSAGTVTSIEENICASPDCSEPRKSRSNLLSDLLRKVDNVPGAVVGQALYRRLGLSMGDAVMLTTPVGIAAARGDAPKRLEFRVTGVFRSGMYEFDSRLVYVELAAAQQLLGLGDAVSGVEFRVSNPNRVEGVAKEVLSVVGRYPYRTLDWRELNSGIFTALKLQKIVMFLVLTFIVIVAAFNIASTLFMAVVEKAREIAVLKSMGSRDASIMKIFVLQGWLTGGIGTVVGVILGLALSAVIATLHIGIAADVYMVEALHVQINPLEVGLTVIASLIISHLATLYPALKAARQTPVDAMRG